MSSFKYLEPDFTHFPGSIFRVDNVLREYLGYDDWVSHFSREDEAKIVAEIIEQVKLFPGKRIHICGISTAESVERIRDYYRECGYEDVLAKSYTLPLEVALTVSVSFGHTLWCEKDKKFLDSHGSDGISHGRISPPLRSPHDLRSLQQGLRMGVILGIEIPPREVQFLPEILKRQIIPPFLLSQMICFRWQKYGFTGTQHETELQYPDFFESSQDN
ncbi:hypothetical protein KA057_01955 [Candidatus Gracilibacteria bacterium]|nr:hypothetical protein [Candidatus Gracilibacteria bacterium]